MLGEIAADEVDKCGSVWNKGRGLRDWGWRSGGSSVERAEAMRRSEFWDAVLKG